MKLLNENKTYKYFKYAIGEVVLIIVGIMMALQLNTWKEERAEAELEQEYIQRLIADVEFDVSDIRRLTALAELRAGYGQLLKDAVNDPQVALENRGEFLVAITQLPRIVTVLLSRDTFEELQSTGYLRLLQDNDLKSMLYEYFRYDEERKMNDGPNILLAHTYLELSATILNFQHIPLEFPVVTPDNIDSIRNREFDESLVLGALKRLRENPEFLGAIQSMHRLQQREIRLNGNRMERAQTLLKMLKAAQKGN